MVCTACLINHRSSPGIWTKPIWSITWSVGRWRGGCGGRCVSDTCGSPADTPEGCCWCSILSFQTHSSRSRWSGREGGGARERGKNKIKAAQMWRDLLLAPLAVYFCQCRQMKPAVNRRDCWTDCKWSRGVRFPIQDFTLQVLSVGMSEGRLSGRQEPGLDPWSDAQLWRKC